MLHEFTVACKNNDLNKIQQMIHIIDIPIDGGFRWACRNGHIDVIRYLVQNTYINIHANNEEGFTWACENGHIDVVRYLVNFMQCVKYRKLNKISQFMPDIYYQWINTYLINVGKYMNHLNHLNNNFIL